LIGFLPKDKLSDDPNASKPDDPLPKVLELVKAGGANAPKVGFVVDVLKAGGTKLPKEMGKAVVEVPKGFAFTEKPVDACEEVVEVLPKTLKDGAGAGAEVVVDEVDEEKEPNGKDVPDTCPKAALAAGFNAAAKGFNPVLWVGVIRDVVLINGFAIADESMGGAKGLLICPNPEPRKEFEDLDESTNGTAVLDAIAGTIGRDIVGAEDSPNEKAVFVFASEEDKVLAVGVAPPTPPNAFNPEVTEGVDKGAGGGDTEGNGRTADEEAGALEEVLEGAEVGAVVGAEAGADPNKEEKGFAAVAFVLASDLFNPLKTAANAPPGGMLVDSLTVSDLEALLSLLPINDKNGFLLAASEPGAVAVVAVTAGNDNKAPNGFAASVDLVDAFPESVALVPPEANNDENKVGGGGSVVDKVFVVDVSETTGTVDEVEVAVLKGCNEVAEVSPLDDALELNKRVGIAVREGALLLVDVALEVVAVAGFSAANNVDEEANGVLAVETEEVNAENGFATLVDFSRVDLSLFSTVDLSVFSFSIFATTAVAFVTAVNAANGFTTVEESLTSVVCVDKNGFAAVESDITGTDSCCVLDAVKADKPLVAFVVLDPETEALAIEDEELKASDTAGAKAVPLSFGAVSSDTLLGGTVFTIGTVFTVPLIAKEA
jgi:hypothetical protein